MSRNVLLNGAMTASNKDPMLVREIESDGVMMVIRPVEIVRANFGLC
jgi:hypothetical protein